MVTNRRHVSTSVSCICEVTGTETSSRLVETIAVTVRSSSASALGMTSKKNRGERKENTDEMYSDVTVHQPIRDALRWSSDPELCLEGRAQRQTRTETFLAFRIETSFSFRNMLG